MSDTEARKAVADALRERGFIVFAATEFFPVDFWEGTVAPPPRALSDEPYMGSLMGPLPLDRVAPCMAQTLDGLLSVSCCYVAEYAPGWWTVETSFDDRLNMGADETEWPGDAFPLTGGDGCGLIVWPDPDMLTEEDLL